MVLGPDQSIVLSGEDPGADEIKSGKKGVDGVNIAY